MSDARLVNFVKYSDKLRNEREDQRGWEWSPDDPACQGADVLNSSSSKVTAQYAENFVPWIRDGVYRHHILVKIVFCVQMINSIIGTGKTVLG